MKELGITKGEWNVNGEYYRHKVMVNNSTIHVYHTVVTFDGVMVTYNNAKANAVLIADAGNTAQKCGLLPSELLRQRDELREALKQLVHLHGCEQEGLLSGQPTPEQWYKVVEQAEAAIKSIENNNQ